jgi:hypothetical protein
VPHSTGFIPVFDGTSWALFSLGAGLSQLTSDSTKSPGACVPNSVYDLFVWNDAGVIRLSRGPSWTSAIARSMALVRQDGLWVNDANITNGPLLGRGTWVGTFVADAAALTTWVRGASALAGAGKAMFNVWNACNRVDVRTVVGDTTASWIYSGSTAWRPANNQVGNRVAFVLGGLDDDVEAIYEVATAAGTAGNFPWAGVGVDSTSAHSGIAGGGPTLNISGNAYGDAISRYSGKIGIGSHFLQALEASTTTSGVTFYGTGLSAGKQMMGLSVNLKM